MDAAAGCSAPDEVGALLRREGLYASHLTKWRKQAEEGQLVGLKAKRRGPAPRAVDPRDKQLADLEREFKAMTHRAERAEALVNLPEEGSELVGTVRPTPEE